MVYNLANILMVGSKVYDFLWYMCQYVANSRDTYNNLFSNNWSCLFTGFTVVKELSFLFSVQTSVVYSQTYRD